MPKCLICYKLYKEDVSVTNFFTPNRFCYTCYTSLISLSNNCIYCMGESSSHFCTHDFYHLSLFKRNGFVDNLFYKIKAEYKQDLITIFEPYIKQIAPIFKDYTIVTVPLSQKRLSQRGFNQSELIAKMFRLKTLNIIERIDNETQSQKSLKTRLDNPPQFRLTTPVSNQKILIVDDIYTTGSTLLQIYNLLKSENQVLTFSLIR